jgi:hypothetical protein
MPQNIPFVAEYFIAQVLTSLHPRRMSRSQNAARQKLDLHVANSRCHTTRSVSDEAAKLRCNGVMHPPISPDPAICDFYLFSRRNHKFASFYVDDAAELLQDGQEMLTIIDRTEAKRAFGHWIERCQWVGRNTDIYHPE